VVNINKHTTFPIYEFRPLESGEYRRFNNGLWTKDDGEHDLAFVDLDNSMCYYMDLPYYTNIRWSWAKDGNWSAFVSKHPNGNAWHYMVEGNGCGDLWARDKHPNIMAGSNGMSYVAKKNNVANGSGPEFHIADPYIMKGLLRNAETKEVVIFPEEFKCMFCGSHNVFQEDFRFL